MIKVLIADDHIMVRRGLKQILDLDDQVEVVAEADDGKAALSLVQICTVDVVVLDITMPGRNGLETLKDLKRLRPALPVIVLSMHPADQYAVRMLRAGAAGYISKESAPEELVKAIKKAYRGEKYINPLVAELLASYVEILDSNEPHEALSDREFEVFVSIGSGKSVSQISEELFLSVKTVSTYRSRIIEKTGLATNAAIIRYCLDRKLC